MSESATVCVKRSQMQQQANGLYAVEVQPGQVLSIQADGSLQTRPDNAIGPWESGRLDGDKWRVIDGGYPTGEYVLLVDLNA